MKRRVRNVLKSLKNINIVKRNIQGNRLYVFPIGDVSFRQEFTEEDLAGIELLGSNDLINPTMFEYAVCDKVGNEYALMDRGVLNGVATGADLGMYNYDLITDTLPEEDLIYEVAEDDYEFEYCMLAEENPLMGTETKVIHTFRGYLEVTMPQEKFSIIRKSVFDSKEESIVYMPQGYVKKYQLRHGDEIVCTYIEDKGKLLMNSLFTINGIYYKDWETDRPCVEELTISREGVCVETEEPCLGVIAKKYKLYQGDSAFVYINKNTSKTQVANLLINELAKSFDKVIYINPQSRPANLIDEGYNVVKFCVSAGEVYDVQRFIALLGANYAKRMIELGQNIALVVDDIDAIMTLDEKFNGEMPTCKTILGTALSTKNSSATSFVLIPLRSDTIKDIPAHNMFRCFETLGIVIDNGEIDLYNSYRV